MKPTEGEGDTQNIDICTCHRSGQHALIEGNHGSRQTTDATTTTRTFDAQNQTTGASGGGSTTPTYDNNGNTIVQHGQTFVYDAWNRLVTVKSGSTTLASYAYDALSRRITETTGSTVDQIYYSPDWQVVEERRGGTSASNLSQQYVWGAGYVDQLILRDSYTSGTLSQRLYVQQDAQFNVTALVDTSGVVQERYLYDPYGAVTITDASYAPRAGNTSSFGWRYLHQGGRLDGTSGWYLFRNRDYIASEGRWAQRDPLGLAAGDMNLYRYVGNCADVLPRSQRAEGRLWSVPTAPSRAGIRQIQGTTDPDGERKNQELLDRPVRQFVTRTVGLMRAFGAATVMTASAPMAATGWGAAFTFGIVLWGSDQMVTGFNEVMTGESSGSVGGRAVKALIPGETIVDEWAALCVAGVRASTSARSRNRKTDSGSRGGPGSRRCR